MEEFGILFFVIFLYCCIGLPLQMAKKARSGKQNAAGKNRLIRMPKEAFPTETVSTGTFPSEGVIRDQTGSALTESVLSERRPFGGNEELYRGSLNAVTGEGEDPCHEEQMESLRLETEETVIPSAGGLQPHWTGNEIVKGLVMSEVLKRRV